VHFYGESAMPKDRNSVDTSIRILHESASNLNNNITVGDRRIPKLLVGMVRAPEAVGELYQLVYCRAPSGEEKA
jgi:hypothetical protein